MDFSNAGGQPVARTSNGNQAGLRTMVAGAVVSIIGVVLVFAFADSKATYAQYRVVPLAMGIFLLLLGARAYSANLLMALGVLSIAGGVYWAFLSGDKNAFRYLPLVVGLVAATAAANKKQRDRDIRQSNTY